MTVGELSARTGFSIKNLREYADTGLIYTVGRSSANYRLFDEDALWCVSWIGNLRSLGLTVAEIRQLARVYGERTDQPVAPHLAKHLSKAGNASPHGSPNWSGCESGSNSSRRGTRRNWMGRPASAGWTTIPGAAGRALDPHSGGRPYGRIVRPHDGGTTMTNTRLTGSTSELSATGGALDLGRDRTRLMTRTFQLLAEGRPVTRARTDQAIAELGIDPDQARQALDAWTDRNDAGDIVGLGVTLNPTPHRMTIGDTQVYAWCALDTLILAIILDRPIRVASQAPGAEQVVRLTARPDGVRDFEPAGAVVTWPARRADQVDIGSTSGIWATFCHHSFFFPSREQAARWAANREDIEILSLDEGFALAREMAAVWLRYGR